MLNININNLPKHFNKEDFISNELINKNLDIEFISLSNFKSAKILREFIEVIGNSL
jgi:hypothetical protein